MKKTMGTTTLLKSVSLLLALAAMAWAQTDRGTIRGTVTDPSGAAIPGAQVSATNTETNVTSRTVATEAGVYSITALPVGTYRVEAAHLPDEESAHQGTVRSRMAPGSV